MCVFYTENKGRFYFKKKIFNTKLTLEVKPFSVSQGHCVVMLLIFLIITNHNSNFPSLIILVPVLSDIALGKPAAQSSMYLKYAAESAVDGNRGTDIIQDLCSHTDTSDTNPWWRVDLQAVYSITIVRILNRGMDIYGIGICRHTQKRH